MTTQRDEKRPVPRGRPMLSTTLVDNIVDNLGRMACDRRYGAAPV